VPLAIADPELEVTLLDSAGKKVRFLNHVKRELALPNITPVQDRLESYEPDVAFDSLVSRAFSDLASFADAARHLVRPAMRLLAMKGRYPDMELRGLPDDVRVDSVEKLSVPGLQEDRHLVIMSFIV
jgi:16S rRNA (guanine527-N7)-methyltransferase